MKTLHTICASSLLLLSPLTFANNINFEISGIKNDSGKIYVQLFKGEENYQNNKAETASMVNAVKGSTFVTFNNVKHGEYAIRFFHDENDNGKMETNLFGFPTEGYGYSNNAKPNFGPVDYSQINFMVSQSENETINKTQVIY